MINNFNIEYVGEPVCLELEQATSLELDNTTSPFGRTMAQIEIPGIDTLYVHAETKDQKGELLHAWSGDLLSVTNTKPPCVRLSDRQLLSQKAVLELSGIKHGFEHPILVLKRTLGQLVCVNITNSYEQLWHSNAREKVITVKKVLVTNECLQHPCRIL